MEIPEYQWKLLVPLLHEYEAQDRQGSYKAIFTMSEVMDILLTVLDEHERV